METAHRCKICFRNFANGKALGGHMRSHVMNLCTQKKGLKREKDEDPFENLEDSPSFRSCLSISSRSSSGNEEEKRKTFGKGSVSADPAEFCSVEVQDWESETDSSRKDLVGRRSKSARNSRASGPHDDLKGTTHFSQIKNPTASETEALSSISDTTSEDEDVAYCLMMLSRDKWKREEKEKGFEDDYQEEYSHVVKVKKGGSKARGKYRCKTCNELFRSYQALGGHRASHKKIKANPISNLGEMRPVAAAAAVEKVHECPFCDRVFASGQALGGHKRSHFVGSVSRTGGTLSIDLNLPAPVDDDGT
ncbi:zinc finger protein ZAT9-like [Primulina eburnea]|uniref:zinc finger protein ZAT9-like n=1 Tax=Primulina eburnea TaxID=1245227 RepID=UPI003C6BDFF8